MTTGAGRRHRIKVGKSDEVRFDYAWKWFSFHAEERTKMFNYMLLALGLLATAIVGSLNSKLQGVAAALSFAASILGAVFFLIDARNRSLYQVALDVLIRIESDLLFAASPPAPASELAAASAEAMALRVRDEDSKTREKSRLQEMFLGRHRFWMPVVILGFASLFAVVGALLAMSPTQIAQTAKPPIATVAVCCAAACAPCAADPAASAASAASSPAP